MLDVLSYKRKKYNRTHAHTHTTKTKIPPPLYGIALRASKNQSFNLIVRPKRGSIKNRGQSLTKEKRSEKRKDGVQK